jgi:predicted Rossmann fold flavoprotein
VREFSTIIVGAGASGLGTASFLPAAEALILERNARPGAKIAVSGGGKCNMANARTDASRYVGDAKFVEAVLKRFDHHAWLKWLRLRGLQPVLRKKDQYFCSGSAAELLTLLQKESAKQRFAYDTYVTAVTKEKGLFRIDTRRGVFKARRLVVASGGLSYPKLGASDIGYRIAEALGHTVVPTAPALTGFTLQPPQAFFKELSGISLEANVTVEGVRCEGSILFAHKGITGPAIYDASLYWKRGKITVDFLPKFVWRTLKRNRAHLSTALPMPKRAAKAFLSHLEIPDLPAFRAGDRTIERLRRLNRYEFAPAGTFGYARAEVTRGGVATDEVDARTMQSRLCEGLYFTGEVLDVTGRLGGYNFQWAFSSAYVAAEAIGSQ